MNQTKYDYAGKRALVTGGATGIGNATVCRLLNAGASVALGYMVGDPRGPQAIEHLATQGFNVIAAPGNVADDVDVERFVPEAANALGGLDLLVNCAGTPGVKDVIPPKNLDALTGPVWDMVFNVNVKGTFFVSKAAAPFLTSSQGAIINIASLAAFDLPGSSMAYAASKAAVVSITKNLARALAPHVRVNAIAPGFVATEWGIEGWRDRGEVVRKLSLLEKTCSADDVAQMIIYYGMEAGLVTGQTMKIDGGFSFADPRSGLAKLQVEAD